MSNAPRTARAISIALSHAIMLLGLALGFTIRIPQLAVATLFILSFVPYIVCIQLIEPWLENKRR